MPDISIKFWNTCTPELGLEYRHYFSVAVQPDKVAGFNDSYKAEDIAFAVDGKWKTHDGSIWDSMGVFPHTT